MWILTGNWYEVNVDECGWVFGGRDDDANTGNDSDSVVLQLPETPKDELVGGVGEYGI